MENNEIHYVTYDPDAIYEEMLTAYADAGGDVIFGGDEKEMLLRAVQAILVQAFAGVDNALRMGTIRYAVGEYLDMIGESRLCERTPAKQAKVTATLKENAYGEPYTIEAGLVLSSPNGQLYTLDEPVELTGTGIEHTVTLTCSEPGAAGNGLLPDTGMSFVLPQYGVSYVVTGTASSGGADEEDDDTYRERIRLSGAANLTTGTALQYEAQARATSSDVIDVHASRGSNGGVDVHVLLKSDADVERTLAELRTALNDPSTRPLTDTVSVSAVEPKTYKLYVTYYAPVGTDLSESATAAVNEYIAWQDSSINRAFNPDILLTKLYNCGCQRVVIDMSRSYFDSGSAVYTPIPDGAYCSGSVELTRGAV